MSYKEPSDNHAWVVFPIAFIVLVLYWCFSDKVDVQEVCKQQTKTTYERCIVEMTK